MEKHSPRYPLPQDLVDCPRDATVCHYCGVSYLVHHEVQRLEKEIKLLQSQLKDYSQIPEKLETLRTANAKMALKHAEDIKKLQEINDQLTITCSKLKDELCVKDDFIFVLKNDKNVNKIIPITNRTEKLERGNPFLKTSIGQLPGVSSEDGKMKAVESKFNKPCSDSTLKLESNQFVDIKALRNRGQNEECSKKFQDALIRSLESNTCNLKAQLEAKEGEISVLQEQNIFFLETYQNTQRELGKSLFQCKQLELKIDILSGNIKKYEEQEKNFNKHLEESTKRENEILNRYKAEKAALIREKDGLNNLLRKIEDELKEQEDKRKIEHETEVAILKEKLQERLINEEEMKFQINQAWGEKFEDYHTEIKNYTATIGRELQSQKPDRVEQTSGDLCKLQAMETELKMKSMLYDDDIERFERTVQILRTKNTELLKNVEEMKVNYQEKEDLINSLYDTIHKQCKERDEIINQVRQRDTDKATSHDNLQLRQINRVESFLLNKSFSVKSNEHHSPFLMSPSVDKVKPDLSENLKFHQVTTSAKKDNPSGSNQQVFGCKWRQCKGSSQVNFQSHFSEFTVGKGKKTLRQKTPNIKRDISKHKETRK